MRSVVSEPRVVARQSGGWLAVSQPEDDLHIGVTASSESEARERFRQEADAWVRLLEQARHDGVNPRDE